MMPALIACTSSPVPGTRTTTEMSAVRTMSTSSWPDADGLDDDDVLAGGVEHQRDIAGRAREPAEMPARGHAADEDAVVADVRLHAHAIAEDRAAGERAGRIDGEDADRLAAGANSVDQPIDERALAGARRAGDADQVRAAGAADRCRGPASRAGGRFVFDQRDRARDRARIAGEHALGQSASVAVDGVVAGQQTARAITSR